MRPTSALFLALAWSGAFMACDGDVYSITNGGEEAGLGSGGIESTLGGSGGQAMSADGGALGLGGEGSTGGSGGEPLPRYVDPILVSVSADDANDQDPALSADELELFFLSNRPGAAGKGDIWRATRASRSAEWGAPEPVASINSPENEATPYLSVDGLTLWFARSDGTKFSLYSTRRASSVDDFVEPVLVADLGGDAEGIAPSVTDDALSLYYSKSGENLDVELFVATRETMADPFGAPGLAPGLNSTLDDWDAVTRDNLLVVFNREGDLYVAKRETPSEPFGEAEPLSGVNTSEDETDPWLSVDGTVLYFSGKRGGVSQLYEARRD